MAGVACLIGVIIGAEYNSPLIYIPFKICIGEGGVLRRVGKVVAHDCDDEIEYSAYVGNARCFSGPVIARCISSSTTILQKKI